MSEPDEMDEDDEFFGIDKERLRGEAAKGQAHLRHALVDPLLALYDRVWKAYEETTRHLFAFAAFATLGSLALALIVLIGVSNSHVARFYGATPFGLFAAGMISALLGLGLSYYFIRPRIEATRQKLRQVLPGPPQAVCDELAAKVSGNGMAAAVRSELMKQSALATKYVAGVRDTRLAREEWRTLEARARAKAAVVIQSAFDAERELVERLLDEPIVEYRGYCERSAAEPGMSWAKLHEIEPSLFGFMEANWAFVQIPSEFSATDEATNRVHGNHGPWSTAFELFEITHCYACGGLVRAGTPYRLRADPSARKDSRLQRLDKPLEHGVPCLIHVAPSPAVTEMFIDVDPFAWAWHCQSCADAAARQGRGRPCSPSQPRRGLRRARPDA